MPGGNEQEAPPARPRGRGRRVLRGLLFAVLGLFLVYLLAANLLLQTPFVESLINRRPEKLRVTYRRAVTLFPGHALAYGVTVRNQASRSQLQISAERVSAVANPLPLFRREVRILRGTVHGPTVRLRSRPPTVEERQAQAPFVPPIDGLEFTLREPPRAPRPSRWKVVVEDVEVLDVREFWYQLARVEGPGTVRGAFTIGPGPRAEVRWDRCDFPALRFGFRNELVLPAAQLQSTGTIEPFDTHERETARVLERISGRADLKGTASPGLAALRPFLARVEGLTLEGDPLDYAVAVRMEAGVLQPGTRAELSSGRAEAGFGGLRGRASLRAGVTIRDEASDGVLALDLALDAPRVAMEGEESSLASARALTLAARLPEFSLATAPRRLTFALTLAEARFAEALDLPSRREGPRAAPRLDVALPGNTIVAGEVTRGEDGAIAARWGPVEFRGLTASLDGRPIVTDGRLTSSGSVGPIARGAAAAGSWLSTLGGTADLDLVVGPELAALGPLLAPRGELVLSGGPARLAVKAEVENGRPRPGSTLTLRADRAGIRTARGLQARGAIDLRAVLSAEGAGAADVALRRYELRFPAASGAAIRGDEVVLRATGNGITLHGVPPQLAVGAVFSGLEYDGTLGADEQALSVATAGPVRIDVTATTERDGATLLRWGPLEIPALAVRLDGRPLLDELRLSSHGALGPLALHGSIDGRRVLDTASGRVQLDARTPAGLAALRGLLPADATLGLGGEPLVLSADVSLARGRLLPGSRVDLESAGLELTASDVVARAAVDLAARVEPDDQVALETTLSTITLAHTGAPGAAGRGERLVLTARAPLGALQGPRRRLDFALDMTDLRFQELTRLDDPLPRSVQDDIGPDDLRLDAAVHGAAHVSGSLALGPGSTFQMDGDTIDIPHFDLDVDGTSLFASAALAGQATLGPYDYGTRGRGRILPVTSGRATITARTAAGLRAIDNLLKSVTWLEIEGGIGFLALNAVVDEGELKPGSNATLELGDLALQVTDFRAGGDARVRAWIAQDERGEFGVLEAELTDVRVAREGTTGLAEADGVSLFARTRDLRLGKAPEDVDVQIALRNARLDTLVGLNALLPKGSGITFTDGSARVDAELSGSSAGKDGRGSIRVRGERLAMSAPGYDFVGDVAIDVPLSHGDLVAGRFTIDGATIGLKDFSVAGGQTGTGDWTSGWSADLRVDDADLVLKGAIAADGDVSFTMRDTAPIVQFFTSRTHVPRFLARAMDVSDVSGSANLSYSPERVEVRDLEVVSDHAQAEARLRVDDRMPSGQLLVVYDWIGIGIGLDGKKTDLRLFGARHWYARLGPDPPEDVDARVDEEIRAWRETRREFRNKQGAERGGQR